jgi:pimeloyl-ACP methyl ester carboxylesterase
MASKPTIVIVPGAWHHPAHYAPLTTRLEKAGYDVKALHLPSTGSNGSEPSNLGDHTPDVQLVASTIQTVADAGNDVVVVVHSAGGITGSEGTINLSKSERQAAGKSGGVVRMVYICAFAAPEGVGLYHAIGGPAEWHSIREKSSIPLDPVDHFYHDVDPEVAKQAVEKLGRHSVAAKWSVPTYAAWKHIPSTYMVCEEDRGIPLAAQEAMISAPRANFTVERCKSAHSPFLSMPDFTAEVVRRAAGETI